MAVAEIMLSVVKECVCINSLENYNNNCSTTNNNTCDWYFLKAFYLLQWHFVLKIRMNAK